MTNSRATAVRLAFAVLILAASSSGQTPAPAAQRPNHSEDEVLVAPLPPGYKIGFQWKDKDGSEKDMYPQNESPSAWTERLATFVYYESTGVYHESTGRTAEQLQASIERRIECKKGWARSVSKGEDHGYRFAMLLYVCLPNTPRGKFRSTWYKAIQGNDNFYVISKEFRFLVSKQQERLWEGYLNSVTICDSRRSGQACPQRDPDPPPPNSDIGEITPLTAGKIQSLKFSINNPSGDYFLGSPDVQKKIVDAFVSDNSKSDPIHLYFAAKTADRIGDIKSAGFLFYAAQIRMHLDAQRFKPPLGEKGRCAECSDLDIYLGFLNATIGATVNQEVTKDPSIFNEVVEMIKHWDVVPAPDALYPSEDYGTYAVPVKKWPAMGEEEKKSFMDDFVAVMRKQSVSR